MPPDAPPPPGEHLDYEDGDTVCEAYVAHPATPAGTKLPCVLIAHAWDGLNEPMRALADRLAALGHLAFALDVYGKGVRGRVDGDNSHLLAPFLADRAMLRRRLEAGLAAARAHPLADPDRLVAIGYCFGGLCVLDLARAAAKGLLGVVSFHGDLRPPNLGPQPPIPAKVLILHGWEDPVAPPDAVLALARELTDARADWQLHAYGHAMHAFTYPGANNPQRGIRHDANAERRSWAAMRAFLEEVLSAETPAAQRRGGGSAYS